MIDIARICPCRVLRHGDGKPDGIHIRDQRIDQEVTRGGVQGATRGDDQPVR